MDYLLRLLKMLESSFTMTIEAPRRDLIDGLEHYSILRGSYEHSESQVMAKAVRVGQIPRRRS